jgi:hypothetical protein
VTIVNVLEPERLLGTSFTAGEPQAAALFPAQETSKRRREEGAIGYGWSDAEKPTAAVTVRTRARRDKPYSSERCRFLIKSSMHFFALLIALSRSYWVPPASLWPRLTDHFQPLGESDWTTIKSTPR